MSQRIEIVRGTTNVFDILVVDAYDKSYTLEDGEKLIFGVKTDPDDAEPLIIKSVSTGKDGVYSVKINPSDTADLECGRYIFDVGLQVGDDYYNIIPYSVFEIVPNITKWGDGS